MKNISQADKITKLNVVFGEELRMLLTALLEKKGFKNIRLLSDCITATQKGLLGDTLAVFITFSHKLGGVMDISVKEIAETITTIRDKHSANSVFIYSNQTISNTFVNNLNQELSSISIQYLGRDNIIQLIDEVMPDFWRHEDVNLIKYEQQVLDFLHQDNDLKKLKFPKENYGRLLNIFVEPKLVRYYEDSKTKTAVQKNYSMSELISHDESLVIDGPAGYGKSTLLKNIVKSLIENNDSTSQKLNLPIYISSLDIYENDYNIGNTLRTKLATFTEAPLREVAATYYVHILVDSIDEFDDKIDGILSELSLYEQKYGIKYYIASRNCDIIARRSSTPISTFSIKRFNLGQIKLFLNAFFSGDEVKTTSLLDAIRDNQMIERLPMTPLTLSLISILYEEKELEIPATISDIYESFNTLIIGKAMVSSKVEFIDISFKERILSKYAYELLQRPQHIPLTKTEFIEFFQKYYEGKSLPIKKGTLEDVLEYLIMNTGVLYLKDGSRVQFTHDSYMEYYSAIEIFKHKRFDEDKLVENFFDPNWQNTAVFYAGMSKDMPDFLLRIKDKISGASNIGDYMSAILGAGFILQALYQTDNLIRRDLVLAALQISLQNLRVFKMMAADDYQLFKNYNLPILTFINFVYFYESFNSITLTEPLRLAFAEKYIEYSKTKDSGIGYNLLELAFTLDSKRIRQQEQLQQLIFDTPEILRDPVLNILATISMDILGKEHYQDLMIELRKKKSNLRLVQRDLIKLPMKKLRFSAIDNINQESNVTILTEGPTDATILEHVFMVLTGGSMPYWNITAADPIAGKNSCAEVANTLTHSYAHCRLDNNHIVIGIFDHDAAGLGTYRGMLSDKYFDELERDSLKKHKESLIYALCIPIPGEMDKYLRADQVFNFFEIEHYLGEDFLSENGMLDPTDIVDIYRIKDRKTEFSNRLKTVTDPKVFEHFLILLKKIDEISGVSIEYVI